MKEVIIYCDGGCRGNQSTDNVGGWGVVLQYGEKAKEIHGGVRNTTNNRMEIQACIEALIILKNPNIPVKIHTDSAYIVNSFNQGWLKNWQRNGWINSQKKPVENKDKWVELLDLYNSFKSVEFIKVKGHSGIIENELADKLANIGMDEVEEEW